MDLTDFFSKQRLFPYKDYSLTGRTYYGGIVYIDLELYSDDAITHTQAMPMIALNSSTARISIAIKQMIAEKEQLFSSTGYSNIVQALQDLHAQPWQNIDELGLIDTKNIRKKRGPLYIADDSHKAARRLMTHISLDAELIRAHRELLPLFRQFAWIITASLQDTLANTYGYYSQDDKYVNSKEAVSIVNTFQVAYAEDVNVNLHQVLDTCLEVTENIRQQKVFDHFMDELKQISYYDYSDLAPNIERTYENTHIFIGAKGWQELAKQENYELLLKHLSIEVKFGRNKVSQKFVIQQLS